MSAFFGLTPPSNNGPFIMGRKPPVNIDFRDAYAKLPLHYRITPNQKTDTLLLESWKQFDAGSVTADYQPPSVKNARGFDKALAIFEHDGKDKLTVNSLWDDLMGDDAA